jgi:hypothetical protein
MTLALTPQTFRDRFALATFPDGGVVVDLETGSYSRLNASGAAVLEELARADGIDAAIAAIADRFRISLPTAMDDLRAITTGLQGEGLRNEPPDLFRYRPAPGGGYDVWHDARHVLHIDESGRVLRLKSPPEDLPLRLYDYVSGIAPKLLFLRGVTVLHGSSCLRGESLLGFCGKSRAGKTTTARTFAKHGSPLISEDLLVFHPDLSTPAVFIDGEARVNRWSREATETLAAGSGATIDTVALMAAASGTSIPLRFLWFLDATRRMEKLDQKKLSRSDTLALVMTNHFLGGGTVSWRRYLSASHAIASVVTAYELELPNGLDRLDHAIQSYNASSTS